MSNVIKAYSIRYEEDKKVIDTNSISEEHIRRFLENTRRYAEVTEEIACSEEGSNGFVEGLTAIKVEALPEEEKPSEEELYQQAQEQMIEKNQKLLEQSQQIIEQAKSEVVRMMNQAKQDAEKLKIDILQKARAEGYESGRAEADDELKKKLHELEVEKSRYASEYEQKVREMEPKFVETFLSFMKHFTGVLLEEQKEIVSYLVEKEFLNIESSNAYLIRVSREDFPQVQSKKEEIKSCLKENTELEIVEDRLLSTGQCFIETDSRVIDCSLDVQLNNLTTDMKLLLD